ncbi:prenyltransferase [Candidatus Bathyarchaeota archaeon]|nr:prenyltransferase [Candidatus Bathyarchaeota archaeon]
MAKLEKLRALLVLSRPAFHSVGVVPFILGTVLSWRLDGTFNWEIFALGTLGVVFIMLATYYAGEYWDFKEDALSARSGSSRFAGGSQILQRGLLSRYVAFWASIVGVVLALAVGFVLQFGYQTGQWTLFFGVLGIFGGFFYSTRPVRWVSRGWGEIWIAFCYGWLPVAVGYYLQTGTIALVIHWMAIPIGFTIFNVILLNEFPDYEADLSAKKTNLAVRLGLERASLLYSFVNVGSLVAMFFSVSQGVPLQILWFYLPIMLLSLVLVALMMRGYWQNRAILERMCAANLIVNLGTTAAFIFAFLS